MKKESVLPFRASWLDKKLPIIFLAPAMIFLVMLFVYPIASSIYFSFTNKSLIFPKTKLVGLENYCKILTDPEFYRALTNSVFFTILIVASQFIVGMIAALCLNRITRLKGFLRTLCIIPWTFPNIVMAFTWNWLLNDLYGPVNALLQKIGIIDSPLLFFGKPGLAIFSVVLVQTWFGFPFMMVNLLAGLQSINNSEYEAASIDGASALHSFIYITLPHLQNLIALIVCLRIIWVFNNFDLIFLLTGGGPGSVTETLPLYAYRLGWNLNNLGQSATVAVLLFIFLMGIISVYFHLLNQKENDAI